MNYSNSCQGMYQPMYAPFAPPMQDQAAQTRQQYPPPTHQDGGMLWVQGEAGAKAFMVAGGNTVVLWDSEANVFYIKTADASGMPYMRVFDYTERSSAPRNISQVNTNQYVTRDEFNALAAKINEMIQPATGGTEVINAE